jgi:DNA-binding MarR family transcriptional regulator
MPIHVDDLTNDEPFPVKPDTNEYEALSFLVAHREYGFTPSEIAGHTEINESSASKTMARLFEKGLVERAEGAYYAAPDRADKLKQRLESLDSAIQLFESVSNDDVYAEEGWEDEMATIDPDEEADTTDEGDSTPAEDQATNLIADLEESHPKNN